MQNLLHNKLEKEKMLLDRALYNIKVQGFIFKKVAMFVFLNNNYLYDADADFN